MVVVSHTRQNQDLEDEGEDELVLAAVRYTGSQSVFTAPAIRDNGAPFMGTMQGSPDGAGPWYVWLVPSRRLGWFENHVDMEVAYDPSTVAEAILEKNTLPSNVFGRNYNQNIRERVLDHLGLDSLPRDTDAVREELAAVAGADGGAGEEAEEAEFGYDLTRSELQDAAGAFDPDFNRAHAQNTELEAFLLEQDDEAVRRVVNQVQAGADEPDPEAELKAETEGGGEE